MIKYLIALLLIVGMGCGHKARNDSPYVRIDVSKLGDTTATDYNKAKDDWIRNVLSKKPIRFDKADIDAFTQYKLTYPECQIEFVHWRAIPYESKESWEYHCTGVDGSMIILQSGTNSKENKISQETMQLITDICYKTKP